MLFSGTIESNLRYADEDASEETLREAADIAQASEFIFAKPEGLAAEIAQGGSNVSGGQKQRLAIARALVKKPPIYHLRRQLLGPGLQDRRRPCAGRSKRRPATARC